MSARIVVAGGHSAGHIEPAMNFADAVLRLAPDARITALGTVRGLDTTLIPARGYPLELIPPVPLPRRLNRDLLAVPARLRAAVRAAGEVLDRTDAQVVVGFGGYVATPAYLAARRRRLPIVVHEANAGAGVANRLAARLTPHVFTASENVRLPHATPIGIPLRPAITHLDRDALRAEARRRFGLPEQGTVLMVTGGSQGAQAINAAVTGAAGALRAAGVAVLHITGPANVVEVPDGTPPYVAVPYVDEMQYAYAAADFVVCRSGAMTVAELGAVGLPAAYVPLPLRGGEARRNAEPVAAAGGALIVENEAFTPEWIEHTLIPILTDGERMASMSRGASAAGVREADTELARRVLSLVGESPRSSVVNAPIRDHEGDRPEDWAAPGAALVRSAATDTIPALADLGRVHIMGIAGSGMSALARILLERGVPVSGCEARESMTVTGLRAIGADVHIGHSADHIHDADTFVYTTAINPRHEEFVAARESGKPFLRRAAALAAALEDRRCVAVAGTHGKTSTTSLLVVAAQACNADPSFAIGGNLYETGRNAHLGSGELAVVEADESDGSFLLTRPASALITNVEADHLENHGDLENIFRAFEAFVDRVDAGGLVLVCADDPGARRIGDYARARNRRVHTYGTGEDADEQVYDVLTTGAGVEFSVRGPLLGDRRVRVGRLIGQHMALNAAAALSLAAHLGLDVDTAGSSWSGFAGVHRRFESHGEGGGVRVFDDYAHHPTEIAASLAAARQALAGEGRLIAVFQPGTYSRTQTFAREFAEAMALADIAIVMDVFPAREEPIPGVTGATISELIELPPEQVVYEPSYDAVPERIAALARPSDLVVTMGIGNVYLLCDTIRDACALAAEPAGRGPTSSEQEPSEQESPRGGAPEEGPA